MNTDRTHPTADFPKEVKDLLHALFFEDADLHDLFDGDAAAFMRSFRKLLDAFHGAEADYAVTGGMATMVHGGRAFTSSYFLVDRRSWKRLRRRTDLGFRCEQTLAGEWWINEKATEATALLVRVAFVDPPFGEMREQHYGLWVVTLPWLILDHLCLRDEYLDEVVSLIRARSLDESFIHHLPPDFHDRFLDCLQRARNQSQDEYFPAEIE